MDWSCSTKSPFPKFSVAEIMKLESIYKETGEKSLDQGFCQELAKSFSSSSKPADKTSISWEQVQNWFQNKQKNSQAKVASSPNALELVADLSEASVLSNEQKSSLSPRDSGEKVVDLSEFAFEARSSKDFAWHDIESFLNYRVMCTGELEVRVRYAGFGKEQDEWINVREGVRERSIPLEPSECHKLKDGDIVLCFLERDDFALYCDARIVKILRRIHDQTECRCIFTVRYFHDNTEETLSWNRICCRPTQDEYVDLDSLNPIESLWG